MKAAGLARMAQQVCRQADAVGGYHRVRVEQPREHQHISRNPFVLWALHGFEFERCALELPTAAVREHVHGVAARPVPM